MSGKEWQRYFVETFPKFHKEFHLTKTTKGNLCGGTRNIFLWKTFRKKSMVNSGYGRVAVCTTQLYLQFYEKNLHHGRVLENFLNFHSQYFFTTPPFELKNQITWKATWESWIKPPPNALIASKHEIFARKEAQKQKIST